MLFRLLFELLLIYAAYKLIKWALAPSRPTIPGGNAGPEINDEDIEDAEYREIKE